MGFVPLHAAHPLGRKFPLVMQRLSLLILALPLLVLMHVVCGKYVWAEVTLYVHHSRSLST
jgi:hypothetical protein